MKIVDIIANYSESNADVKTMQEHMEELVYSYCASNDKYNVFGRESVIDSKEYRKTNKDLCDAVLGFCESKAGFVRKMDFSRKKDVQMAFSNSAFTNAFYSIVVEVVNNVTLNADPKMLEVFTNIETVELGDSFTGTIETKGLPVVQRQSYTSNVTFHEGVTSVSHTITPEVYSGGTQMDFIRFANGTFDFGKEIGRIAMAMLYAQYKLVVGMLFNTTSTSGTPFVLNAYNINTATEAKEFLEAVNGGGAVRAYATSSTFAKAGTVATADYGFASQDTMIQHGMLGEMYGIENIALPNITDGSKPFAGVDVNDLLIPSNKILMMSDVGSKPVTLVREDYVRVIQKDANENALNTHNYSFSQGFNVGVITQAQYVLFEI